VDVLNDVMMIMIYLKTNFAVYNDDYDTYLANKSLSSERDDETTDYRVAKIFYSLKEGARCCFILSVIPNNHLVFQKY
jgi:hypothetical protein